LARADETSVTAAGGMPVAQPAPLAVAIPVTTIDAGEIDQRRVTSLADVALAAPEITLTPALNSSSTPVIYMRGQGLDNPSQITRDSPIGVYQDGFYVA